jgi:hypothetical protein
MKAKPVKRRIHWGILLLLTTSVMSLWVQLMILYRIRNVDEPKEVRIMMPQLNSNAVETACQ